MRSMYMISVVAGCVSRTVILNSNVTGFIVQIQTKQHPGKLISVKAVLAVNAGKTVNLVFPEPLKAFSASDSVAGTCEVLVGQH